ncbi:MAG: hypothetical protein ABR608_07560 [Pseudonocardiaceae bacterium]
MSIDGSSASPTLAGAGGVGPVAIVSRAPELLDVFTVGADGGVYTAAWQPGDADFRGWWRIGGLQAAPCAPVTAVSRSRDKLDVLVAGLDGQVYTAAWEPGDTDWRGWWPVGGLVTVQHATVSAVSRSADKLDVFASGPDGRVYTAAWEPGDDGFRGWWPIGDLVTGQSDPEVGRWRKVGVALTVENTDYSHEAQGVTTDGGAWYLVSNGSKVLRKMNDRAGLIREVAIPQGRAGAHVGAPGYYDGWVYVPVQGPYGVWRATADLSRSEWFPLAVGALDLFPWCAVNPLNGRLYTSDSNIAKRRTPVLFAYDRNTMERRPEDDIRLTPGPIPLESVQGGHFTPRGRVLLCGSGPNRVHCFSTLTGHCFGSQNLGDFGSFASEMESVTVRPWQFGDTPAPVHLLELDNDWPTDDCYLHSYWVPQPDLL